MFKRVLFFLIFSLGCSQNYEEGAHPPPIPPQQAPAPAASNQPTSEPEAEAVIAGTIKIDPTLVARLPKQAVLFIIARPAPSGGPPLAVKRLPMPTFPYSYQLTQADAGMMPGQDVDLKSLDALYVSVKIDQDGKVGPTQAGDMEGVCAENPIVPGKQDAHITINKVY